MALLAKDDHLARRVELENDIRKRLNLGYGSVDGLSPRHHRLAVAATRCARTRKLVFKIFGGLLTVMLDQKRPARTPRLVAA
jgi:hypothetical protein